jgi:hypothetical protein
MQEVHGGSSYQASNDLRLHFGLGDSEKVQSLTVRWTDGMVQKFFDVAANRQYRLTEGKDLLASHP